MLRVLNTLGNIRNMVLLTITSVKNRKSHCFY
jgi:hypothetical protein